MSDAPLDKYRARLSALGGRGGETGAVLTAAGDVLRRTGNLRGAEADEALRGLSREAVEAWLERVDPQGVEGTLLRAAEEAAEAALAEGGADSEAELWRGSALDGLAARDQSESQVRALAHWEALRGPLQAEAGRRLRALKEGLQRLDQALAPGVRWFTGLNPERRRELQLLDLAERERAWWYCARVDCDDLLPALAGEAAAKQGQHVRTCADCRADLKVTDPVEAPFAGHITAELLWRYEEGLLAGPVRARVEAHAKGCGECAGALLALDEGEAAIREALEREDEGPAPVAARSSREPAAPRAARSREGRHLIEERRDFRVVLVRDRQRVQVVVQPFSPRVTATLFFAAGRASLKPAEGPEGLTFDLTGAVAQGVRAVHLTVTAGRDVFETDVEL